MSDQPTPMMAQYLAIRDANPGALLFYRMGDFYEMFFDDAVAAAAALDIALTKRGTHEGQPIPMCGVPVHAAESYLLTLIRKGFRVAIAEQMEDPAEARKRGSKSVVARDVVRLVTPGTLTEESLLEARRHNFLAAFATVRQDSALAWVDISTGAFQVMECPLPRLGPELARLTPREILACEGAGLGDLAAESGAALTDRHAGAFDSGAGARRLCALYGVETLDGFGTFGRAELSAMGAIGEYLEMTQKGRLPLLRPPARERHGAAMQIDASTRRNLELTQALSGGREGSLLAAIDRTVTAAGARLLERRISAPSRDLALIHARHDAVAQMVDDPRLATDLREALARVPDMDRALSRLALDRGGPRDLAAIRAGLTQGARIAARLSGDVAPILRVAARDLAGHDDLIHLLEQALVAEPPLLGRDGGFVAPGHDADLDQTRRLRDEGRGVIAGMQADYAARAGVQSLKIRHNNVLGYFIETTTTHADRMLAMADTFIHRQTTANQIRFTTVELSELETRILNARDRALEIERGIFDGLRAAVLALSRRFNEGAEMVESYHLAGNRRSAWLLARLGFRPVGQEMRWSRPHGREMAAVKLRLARDDFAARHGIALATARLLIDAPRPADLPALHQIVTTPQIARMLLLFHPGMSVEDIAPIFGDQSLTLPMRLVARSGGRVVGSVGIGAGEKPRIYYFLAPDQVGQGLGQEMVGAFLDEIRARFDPAELLADVFLDNQPSRLLLKNLGFQRGEDGPLASLGRDSVDEGTVYNWRRRPAS